jgi:hypothetical protein
VPATSDAVARLKAVGLDQDAAVADVRAAIARLVEKGVAPAKAAAVLVAATPASIRPKERPKPYWFIPSDNLASWLRKIDDNPVAIYRMEDEGVAKLKIAELLRHFGIQPERVPRRINGQLTRGYLLAPFRPVWRSYGITAA